MNTSSATLPITERVKTWADILAANNTTQEQFDQQWAGRADYEIAEEQKRLMALALNEGTEMKTADTTQTKHFPYFRVEPDASKKAGFGLSFHVCDFSRTLAFIGARHALKDPALARYAGTQFIDFYERAMV